METINIRHDLGIDVTGLVKKKYPMPDIAKMIAEKMCQQYKAISTLPAVFTLFECDPNLLTALGELDTQAREIGYRIDVL